jgi:hypothetical protein
MLTKVQPVSLQVYCLDSLELDVSQAVQLLKGRRVDSAQHMKMLSRSERVYSCDGGDLYCLEGLCPFFQRDQNQLIRDGDEAAEIQV